MSEAREETPEEGTVASDVEAESSAPDAEQRDSKPAPPASGGRGAGAETLCGALSLLLPLTLYTWTAAASPTWLDSAEFLATGFALGAAHPPGHPIFVTLVKLFTLIPLGPVAFRAALASAVPAALACFLLFRLSLHLSRKLDRGAPGWLPPIFAMLGALLFGATPALWAQATRPEVYALQLATVLVGFLALIHYGLEKRGIRDGKLLVAAAFAFGLALANHHFLAFLLVPGVIVFLTEDALARWRRTLKFVALGIIPSTLVGLVAYAHLPLRATNAPGAVSLGAAPNLSTFIWVITAKAFQRAVTEPPTNSYGERLTDAAFLLATQLGPFAIPAMILTVAALGGLYFLAREKWGVGLLLVLGLVATWLAQSWIGFDRLNPDVLGYLLVPICVLAVGAARVGPLLVSYLPGKMTVRIGAATVVGLSLVATSTLSLFFNWNERDMSGVRSAEIVATEQLNHLPPRSVLVTELFGSGFNLWAAQTVEGMRPDVSHFHFPFVGFPSYVQQVHRVHRDLRGILRAALARGAIDEQELSALAQRRPVYMEPMLQTPRDIQPFLLPRGLTWEAAPEPLSLTDVQLAATNHFAQWDRLIVLLGDEAQDEQTMRVLLWRIYIDALLLAQRGEREAAAGSVDRGLQLAPGTPELVRLGAALEEGTGRLDVTPFLPRAAQPQETPEETDPEDERPRVLDF